MVKKFTNIPVTYRGTMIGRADVDVETGVAEITMGGPGSRELYEYLQSGIPESISVVFETIPEQINRGD